VCELLGEEDVGMKERHGLLAPVRFAKKFLCIVLFFILTPVQIFFYYTVQ